MNAVHAQRPATRAHMDAFLGHLARWPHVADACRVAGLPLSTAFLLRRSDAEFASAWHEAKALGLSAVMDEVRRRGGIVALSAPGCVTGAVAEKSDAALLFVLRCRRSRIGASASEPRALQVPEPAGVL
jgi:hypothetical protein